MKKELRIDYLVAALLLFAMAAIAFANVVSRYFFHFSIASTEEITINMFVWMTVVGCGIAFERGGQLGVVTFFDLFPERMQKCVILTSAFLSALLFVLVDFFMLQAIHDELTIFHATSASLSIPVWIYYAGVPFLSVFVFRGIYRDAIKRLNPVEKSL
ncbi:DctQ10 [Desulforapulum autotrophicum HRM2]|uniref:DctQ10 n=1 Tax=Desulforapulum autotrophicum (strain ATCC 43914 / DSM 3382 / VKM B-1955 / HRM2) TaxID=177437 RepID=C0QG36_DESAH|nr:TRAP transporter small permease subunit [Desulforapulum autotrophicum]ACN17615.1 DctQ10 [Desulforapulum autotrophicum HRM2]